MEHLKYERGRYGKGCIGGCRWTAERGGKKEGVLFMINHSLRRERRMGRIPGAWVVAGVLILGLCLQNGEAASCSILVKPCQKSVVKLTPPPDACCNTARLFTSDELCTCISKYPDKYYPRIQHGNWDADSASGVESGMMIPLSSITMVCDTKEIEVNVPRHRLWAAMKDGHNLIPKIMNEEVTHVEHCEGDGSVGSIRKVHFHPHFAHLSGSHYIKEKLVHIDESNYTVGWEGLEGGPIGNLCSSFTATSTFAPGKDDSHSLCKLTVNYEPIGEPDLSKMQAGPLNMIKKIEAYLVAHPQEYC